MLVMTVFRLIVGAFHQHLDFVNVTVFPLSLRFLQFDLDLLLEFTGYC